MSENQTKLNENRKKHVDLLEQTMRGELPALGEGIDAVSRSTYVDGALSTKSKRLMALALALGVGCRNCVLAQTECALAEGATKKEFLETIAVVMAMRGTTGVAESLRVIQYLDENGNW